MDRPTEAQTKQWNKQGFLMLENAIEDDELQRLQDAVETWAERCKPDWLERVERGEQEATYYDIPNPIEKDEIFVDIVDHPSYYGYLRHFTDDEPMFLGEAVRTLPSWPLSYSAWHPDVPHTHPLHIKIQVYVNDVDPGCGEFAYVPGSHKPDAGPYTQPLHQESMPGHRTFPAPAGAAVMFNTYGWHAAMDNRSAIPRKSVIRMRPVDPTCAI